MDPLIFKLDTKTGEWSASLGKQTLIATELEAVTLPWGLAVLLAEDKTDYTILVLS